MQLKEFQNVALKQFTKEITDIFFYYLENDRELLKEYLRVVGRGTGLDETNKSLGLAVKEYFGLDNLGENHAPKSKLIVTYTEHVKKQLS